VGETEDGWLCGGGSIAIRHGMSLNPRFLQWFLTSRVARDQLLAASLGATMDTINEQILMSLRVNTPTLRKQEVIADYLDVETARIDALIAKKQRMTELLRARVVAQQSRLILRDLDPISGAGRLPSGWQLMNLGTLIVLQRGHDLPWIQRIEGEVPVVSSGGTSGTHNVAIGEPPGVVTGRYGTIGEVFWLDVPYWPLNTTLYVQDFRNSDPRWVYHLLRALPLNFDEEKSAVTGINRNVVGQLRVGVPPVSQQREISEELDRSELVGDALMQKVEKQIGLLQERRQALITAAVTGQIDVPEVVHGNH